MDDLCIVRLVILLLRGWSEHFIGQGNPDDNFNMLKFHYICFCNKLSFWSILLQNGTSAFRGSLYINFIGHAILDLRIGNVKEF